MLKLVPFFVVLVLASCSSSKKSEDSSNVGKIQPKPVVADDTVAVAPVEIPPQPQVTAVKPNLSLIGAVVSAIELVDSLRYKAHIDLRTAIPMGGLESVAEPGQSLVVVPAYRVDEMGKIKLTDPINRKLFEARSLKNGDFLFGKISLHQDGIWYLEDTGFE